MRQVWWLILFAERILCHRFSIHRLQYGLPKWLCFVDIYRLSANRSSANTPDDRLRSSLESFERFSFREVVQNRLHILVMPGHPSPWSVFVNLFITGVGVLEAGNISHGPVDLCTCWGREQPYQNSRLIEPSTSCQPANCLNVPNQDFFDVQVAVYSCPITSGSSEDKETINALAVYMRMSILELLNLCQVQDKGLRVVMVSCSCEVCRYNNQLPVRPEP